jgi:hypothetical protein
MKRMRWTTGEPYGFAGVSASARWSGTPAAFGLDVFHAAVCAMANVKAIAQRPLGLAGGTTG